MAEPTVRTVVPPASIWRIGRGQNPLRVRRPDPVDLSCARAGNRFDSALGIYGILYFATELLGCFGETLARFRPSPELVALVRDEWREAGFMIAGVVPQDWRSRRTAVRVRITDRRPFLDVEHPETHAVLREELAPGLALLGYDDLDVSTVRGPDRRPTRLISQWAWSQYDENGDALYAGVRYLSRIDTSWELWAAFDDVVLDVIETRPITLDMPEVEKISDLFKIKVF